MTTVRNRVGDMKGDIVKDGGASRHTTGQIREDLVAGLQLRRGVKNGGVLRSR